MMNLKFTAAKRMIAFGVCFFALAGFFACTGAKKNVSPAVDTAAVNAAKAWLVLLEQGKFAETWDGAAAVLKKAVTKDQWIAAMGNVQGMFGKTLGREIISATLQTSLPGAPDGKYVVIQFKTKFEKKGSAVETITPALEGDGAWRVAGYFIK